MGLASAALAGENAIAGISLHITEPSGFVNPCLKAAPSFPDGGDSIVDRYKFCNRGPDPSPSDLEIWLVVCNGSDSLGVKGVEFGIDYDGALGSGVDVNSWILCADGLEFPMEGWPAAGTGTLVTWTTCQDESSIDTGDVLNHQVIAPAGVFQVTAYGRSFLKVTPRPVTGLAKVADCLAAEDVVSGQKPSQLGTAGICQGAKGYNFCGAKSLATQSATWGGIKSLYN
jgi:hypothetical protein